MQRHHFHATLVHLPGFHTPKVGYDNWVSMASGPFGFYAISFASGDRLRAEVYLDTGAQETTKALFDRLAQDQAAIEDAMQLELSWERLDDKRASRVATYREAPNLAVAQEAKVAADWAAASTVRFMDTLDDRLRQEARTLRRA